MTAPTLGRQQAHGIPLLHAPGSRSERVRWTAAELDIPLDLLSPAAPGGERAIAHPLNKVPAIMVQGEPLFESLAICNWLADSHPHRDLGWRAGSWNRALHDQWTAFALTELEANLWHTARNKFVYPPGSQGPSSLCAKRRGSSASARGLRPPHGESRVAHRRAIFAHRHILRIHDFMGVDGLAHSELSQSRKLSDPPACNAELPLHERAMSRDDFAVHVLAGKRSQ